MTTEITNNQPASGAGTPPAPAAGTPAASPAAGTPPAPAPALRHHGSAPAAKPTGEQHSATRENVASEQQQQNEAEPFELQVPGFVPLTEQTEERQGFVNEFSTLAPSVGIEAGAAQSILDAVIDVATAIDYSHNFELEHSTAEEGEAELVRLFGYDRAKGLATNCQQYVAARGEQFANWLDSTGLGNDPSVVAALALANANFFNETPEVAKAHIAELMKSKEYAAGDRLTIIKIQGLSRIANRNALSASDRLNAAALEKQMTKPAAPAAGSDAQVRARIAKLLDPKGPLLMGGPEQAAHKAEYFALLAKLS